MAGNSKEVIRSLLTAGKEVEGTLLTAGKEVKGILLTTSKEVKGSLLTSLTANKVLRLSKTLIILGNIFVLK